MSNSYYRWSTTDDISLFVQLVSTTGEGATGKSPEVAIRRARATHGAALDLYFWNGATWQNTAFWLPMSELDAVNNPGAYTYLFLQSGIASEWVYLVYYRHTADPVGFAVEEHVVTNELYIPVASPFVPVSPGDTVMGRLAAMEDPDAAVAQANADAVWDETLGQHLAPGTTGEALARLATATSGSKQIAVTVLDGGAAPIQGCQIDVYGPTNVNFISRMWTDVNGHVALAIDPGTYALRLFASGYAFTVPEMLVVTVDAAVTYVGSNIVVITPPASPNLCAIYGTIRDAGGTPISNAKVQAYAVTPQTVGTTVEAEAVACTVTDANGFFQLNLERKAEVSFAIEDAGIDLVKTVPDAASQNFATWA
jgi:hypothetical protein